MNRKYALPMAAALVFHAALLFGFRSPAEIAPQVETTGNELEQALPTTLEVVTFPEPPDESVQDELSPSRAGDPEVNNLSRPDFATTTTHQTFTMPVEPYSPEVPSEVTRINPGIKGVIDGDIQGVLKSRGVITARMLDNRPRAIAQSSPLYPGEAKFTEWKGKWSLVSPSMRKGE